jgi:cellulose synthase/poly-beta-1,6-N-acetylglucosamine synthase-like glycosyltransferase
MTFVAIVLCIVVVCLGWMQLFPGLIFARLLFQPKPAVLEDAQCPKAAVLLSVRGNDPFLGDCVASLLRQDYPTFDIRIIVDHETDPSWRVIQDIVTRMNPSNVTISVLGEKFGTCTLKPNSLLQALSQLDDSYEVIAILDSDAVTHPTWLKELVAPLQDETIGVASGNRWYMPQRATIGSLVRYTWNAAAVVQMYFGHFTWGGSVAIRGSVVRNSKLQDRWRHSIAEDTAIYGEVRASGMKAAFVPSLMIVNRESCGLLEFYVWMKRQLLVGRLQHAGWHMVFWHAAITSLLLTASVVLLVAAVATGNGPAVIWLGAGLVAYTVLQTSLLFVLEAGVRKTARDRNQPTNWMTLATLGKLAIALPLTQILYSAAIPTIRFMRDVSWRGVKYRIEGPWNIRLISYKPFEASKHKEESQASL